MQTVVRVWGSLLALVPFLFFSNVSDKGLLAQSAAIAVLLGAGLLFFALHKINVRQVLHPVVGIALLVLVGGAFVGLGQAQVLSLGLGRAGTLLVLAGLVLVLATLVQGNWFSWSMALRAWTGVMLVECLLGFAQVWGWTDFAVFGEQPPMGTLAFRNGLCEVLAVSTPLAVALFRTDPSVFRWLGVLGTVLFSAMVWTEEVTGAQLAWTLSMVVMVVFEIGERLRSGGRELGALPWRMLGLALIFVVGLVAGGLTLQKRVAQMDVQTILQTQSSSEERLVMWEKSVALFVEHPVLGVGTGQWPIHALEKGLVGNFQGFGTRFYRRAHNDFLQLFAEQGFLGGLALMVLLLGAAGLGWARIERKEGPRWLFVGAVAGLTAWAAVALVNFPLERPVMLLVLGGLLAIVAGQKTDCSGNWLDSVLAGNVGMALLGFAYLFVIQHQSEQHVFNMLEAKSRKDWPAVEREARAARGWHLELESTTLSPLDWYLGTALLSTGRLQAGKDVLRQAHELHPWYPHTLTNLATVEAMTGDPNAASALLEQALERFPEFDEARMNLVRLCVQFKHQDCIEQQVQYWKQRGIDPRINVFLKGLGLLPAAQP